MNRQEYSGRDNLNVMAHAKNYNRYLLNLIMKDARLNQLIVDFGAGNGTFAAPLADAKYQVVCIETDPQLTADLQIAGLRVLNDIEQLADESVDYLYSLNVLEHIEDDLAIAQLWFKKIRPGGQLLVFVPAFQFLFTSMDHQVGHYRRYTQTSLSTVLKKAQFQITHSRYVDSLGILAALLYKVLDQGGGQVNLGMLKIYDQWVFPLSRILDLLTNWFGGKNVLVRAIKPGKSIH
jgi:2-polyprenyl-3-methyl-5-hydroxy-6-metoxy-1,4-benzoquinol methylase